MTKWKGIIFNPFFLLLFLKEFSNYLYDKSYITGNYALLKERKRKLILKERNPLSKMEFIVLKGSWGKIREDMKGINLKIKIHVGQLQFVRITIVIVLWLLHHFRKKTFSIVPFLITASSCWKKLKDFRYVIRGSKHGLWWS